MSLRNTQRIRLAVAAAALGVGVLAAGPAFAGPAHYDYLSTPGEGVVQNIGNDQAANTPVFNTGKPRLLYVYNNQTGEYVKRSSLIDKTSGRPVESAALDFGINVN